MSVLLFDNVLLWTVLTHSYKEVQRKTYLQNNKMQNFPLSINQFHAFQFTHEKINHFILLTYRLSHDHTFTLLPPSCNKYSVTKRASRLFLAPNLGVLCLETAWWGLPFSFYFVFDLPPTIWVQHCLYYWVSRAVLPADYPNRSTEFLIYTSCFCKSPESH